ncbi:MULTISPECIES: hypothetical protein [Chryseobacterium]|uniref:hypothetical protein n=1 Tax=Chryseobacterium TaxID=59732 RepID=UPI001BE76AFD|nr:MULTISPECIES: hypothetical protein [Chryseobacterium]MBT2620209.1 hypothetical protein [Chryseobacterium sp. ISL-6]
MNILVKFSIISIFLFLLVFSCANYKRNITPGKNAEKVEFTEIRRLNAEINLKEYTLINSTKGIKELYRQLDNSKFSRSAPIPVLEESGAYFLVLKPQLKNKKYGDIEIEKLEMNNSILLVNYKEIENREYAEEKQSNPIVILKVFNKPTEIKLNLIK